MIGALLLNACRKQPLPGSSPGLATDPPKGGWRLLGWRHETTATPSEIQSDDKSSHSKVGDNHLPHFVTPFHDLSPLAPEERRGEGTGGEGP